MRNTLTRQNTAIAAALAAAASVIIPNPASAVDDPPVATVTLPMLDEGIVITIRKATPQQSTTAVTNPSHDSQVLQVAKPVNTVIDKTAPVAPALAPPAPSPPAPAPAPPAPSPPAPASALTPAVPVPAPAPAAPAPAVPVSAPAPAPVPAPATPEPVPASTPAPALTPVAPSNRASGLPFDLGVFGHSTDRAARFEERIGRPVDVIGVFPTRGSWESIMDPWWLDRAPQGFKGTLDVGVPLWQDDGALASAASGGYDAQWEELGRVIHERYPGSSVRIGWEFNLGGWQHHASEENVEQWVQAFRHASSALKKGGPSLRVSWNPNKGRGDSLPDASKAWPGDDVVDIVALDAYDWWPGYDETTWPEHRDGEQGWKHWVDFARSHRVKFAVPEWGVAPGNDHSGGDNPYYIEAVMDFLKKEHAKDGIIDSVVYFDEPDSYIANSIGDGQVPRAGKALQESLDEFARSKERIAVSEPALPGRETETGQAPAPAPAQVEDLAHEPRSISPESSKSQGNDKDSPKDQAIPLRKHTNPVPVPVPAPLTDQDHANNDQGQATDGRGPTPGGSGA